MSRLLLYELPISVAFISTFVILLAAIEIGYRAGLARFRRPRDGDQDIEFTRHDVTLTTLLGFLGLILAFTYAFELNRQDMRKQAIVVEANAIGTAFLRADFAAEPARTRLRAALLEYAKTRTASAEQAGSKEDRDQLRAHSLAVQATLWPLTKELVEENELPGPIEASIIMAVNDVLDAGTTRSAIFYDRMPPIIFVLLVLIGGLSFGMATYNAGLEGRINRWRITMFAFIITSLMTVIVDSEKSATGIIQVSQTPIIEAIESLEAELQREKD